MEKIEIDFGQWHQKRSFDDLDQFLSFLREHSESYDNGNGPILTTVISVIEKLRTEKEGLIDACNALSDSHAASDDK